MAQVHALLLPGIEQAELLQGRKAADAPLWRKEKRGQKWPVLFCIWCGILEGVVNESEWMFMASHQGACVREALWDLGTEAVSAFCSCRQQQQS